MYPSRHLGGQRESADRVEQVDGVPVRQRERRPRPLGLLHRPRGLRERVRPTALLREPLDLAQQQAPVPSTTLLRHDEDVQVGERPVVLLRERHPRSPDDLPVDLTRHDDVLGVRVAGQVGALLGEPPRLVEALRVGARVGVVEGGVAVRITSQVDDDGTHVPTVEAILAKTRTPGRRVPTLVDVPGIPPG